MVRNVTAAIWTPTSLNDAMAGGLPFAAHPSRFHPKVPSSCARLCGRRRGRIAVIGLSGEGGESVVDEHNQRCLRGVCALAAGRTSEVAAQHEFAAGAQPRGIGTSVDMPLTQRVQMAADLLCAARG